MLCNHVVKRWRCHKQHVEELAVHTRVVNGFWSSLSGPCIKFVANHLCTHDEANLPYLFVCMIARVCLASLRSARLPTSSTSLGSLSKDLAGSNHRDPPNRRNQVQRSVILKPNEADQKTLTQERMAIGGLRRVYQSVDKLPSLATTWGEDGWKYCKSI